MWRDWTYASALRRLNGFSVRTTQPSVQECPSRSQVPGGFAERPCDGIAAGLVEDAVKRLTSFDLPFYYEFLDWDSISLVTEVRTKAVQSVALCWPKAPQTKKWLKDRARSDDDSDVRQAACRSWLGGGRTTRTPWRSSRPRPQRREPGCPSGGGAGAGSGWKDDRTPWRSSRTAPQRR